MHIHKITENLAIYWSPRCGHGSTYWTLDAWEFMHIGLTLQQRERDLPAYTNPKNPKMSRPALKKIEKESLKSVNELVLVRDPWKRFKSFWRWQRKNSFLDPSITPFKYIDNFNYKLRNQTIPHHSMPQWSQASCLLDGDEEYFDLEDFDSFVERIAELTGNNYIKPKEVGKDDWGNYKEEIIKPSNFSDLYGKDEEMYYSLFPKK
jgi:hypothetical protein